MHTMFFALLTAVVSPEARANDSQYLTFESLARDAEDVQLVNVIEQELVEINLEQRRYVYQLNAKLSPDNAVARYELAMSLVKVLASEFRVVSNESTSKIKEYEAQIWHLRADWALHNENEDPQKLAQIAIAWRTEVLRIAQTGIEKAEKIEEQLTFMRKGADVMFAKGAIDSVEYQYYVTLDEGGKRLSQRMRDAVAIASKALDDARNDLARFSHR